MKDETGASILEFSMVLPILVTLILGIIQLGIFFSIKISLINGASAAARYSILTSPSPSDSQVSSYMTGMLSPLVDPSKIKSIKTENVTVNGFPARKVFVEYEAVPVVSLPGFNKFNIQAQAIMR